MSRIPASVVAEVLERAQNACEACGGPAYGKMDLHHRRMLSQGGQNAAVNLLWCHHYCHVGTGGSIHANPARSRRLGHIVPSWADPAEVPVIVEPRLRLLRA